ncbi:glucosamine-6-phosphate deaminase [Chitinophaga oryzae]|uniref:Glucosamine-6-phosphate deaminase n=1 Tax=Chitinophaga oryzae TaxID=2725414 RepID=A0ABX6L998_9BACT|nr:glucosamine-6-phosphate deaminase [Chitinophaga oryzae]QJB36379.1 glucosamine-6-phosphate deaminase [Chitinophaga oryzae]
MKVEIYSTYEALSEKVAEQVIQLMAACDEPLLCPASGDTPAGLYQVLAERYRQQPGNIARWRYVGLDEWVGLNGTDQGSCRYSIDKALFQPLQVSEENICFFDGRSADLPQECEAAERFIKARGGIDVAILGLGMNGHIAMNEPGCAADGRAQVAALHPVTKQVGQKYFQQHLELEKGITLGMGTLLESRHIILMVSGKHKAGIVRKLLEGPATNDLPASLLQRHPAVTIFLDEDAASGLTNRDAYADNRH